MQSISNSSKLFSPYADSAGAVTNRYDPQIRANAYPSFKYSHLWRKPIINPVNLKSHTLPILNLNNPYSKVFHFSWLGLFVAFVSWFAFPPLFPNVITSDLKLTTIQVANSNILASTATILVLCVVGPLIDYYGPRKVMAGLLFLGAIPSGLVGTVHTSATLYVVRFSMGILGATFVPCLAWTSAFFDTNCVGTANALVGGWGNMGGGATFAIMVSLYSSLRSDGPSQHSAWRAAFAIIPAPMLLLVAALSLYFGQDHPAGRWSRRHRIPATAISVRQCHEIRLDSGKDATLNMSTTDGKNLEAGLVPRGLTSSSPANDSLLKSPVDLVVNEALTRKTAVKIYTSPLTWLPAFAYLTTFGLVLATNGQMANIFSSLFTKKIQAFDETKAGYYASVFGLLNLVTRPFGGFAGDWVYVWFGMRGKKYWALFCGLVMGFMFLAGGLYLESSPSSPHLPTFMGIFSVSAIFSEFGNGATFAMVPHCNPHNNGVMSSLVGSFGSLGGIIFASVFRFEADPAKAIWTIGVLCIVINVSLMAIPVPKH